MLQTLCSLAVSSLVPRAQDVFKQALQADEIMLRVVKNHPPPVFPKPNGKKPKPDLTLTLSPSKHHIDPSSPHKSEERKVAQVLPTKSQDDQEEPSSPSKKVPPAVPERHPNTALSSPTKTRFTAPTNTRRIGKKIHIHLTKGEAEIFTKVKQITKIMAMTLIYICLGRLSREMFTRCNFCDKTAQYNFCLEWKKKKIKINRFKSIWKWYISLCNIPAGFFCLYAHDIVEK